MIEHNLSTRLLDGMDVVEQLSENGGAYLLRRLSDGQEFVLKYISLPQSSTQIEGLRLTGAIQSDDDARAYYSRRADDYRTEIAALEKLAGVTNIAAFDAVDIHEKENDIGYDLYLLSARRQTLAEYFAETPMTQLKAADLALDLCGALTDLRKAGLMHANVKPENILLNQKGHFMLSDLGLYRTDMLKFAAFPRRMLNEYSAPELYDDFSPMNATQDIYAVGVILYNVYNGGHAPFEDERTSAAAATARRVSGDTLPVPLYADYEMSEIILKACAFDPEERYQTPEALKDALTDYVKRNVPEDTIIVPPIVVDEDTQITAEAMEEKVEPVQFAKKEELDEAFIEHFSPDTASLNEIIASVQEEMETEPPAEDAPAEEPAEAQPQEQPTDEETPEAEESPAAEPAEEKKKKRVPFWVWIIVAAVVLAAAATALYLHFTPVVTGAEALTGTDTFTLTAETEQPDAALAAYCVDAYGNRFDGVWDGSAFRFEGLNPGTQYTVHFTTADGRQTRGMQTFNVSTQQSTEILYFVAKPLSETQLELNFNIAGPDHDSWRVTYSADGGEEKTVDAAEHRVTIGDLAPNAHYTFTLSCPDGTELTGETTLTYDTTVSVTEVDVTAHYDTDASALTLEWVYTGDAPAEWVVTCYGADGSADTKTVPGGESAVTFEELTTGEMYTVELYCRGMAAAVQTAVRTSGMTIAELAVERTGGDSAAVTWSSEDAGEWIVTYQPQIAGVTPMSVRTDETAAELKGLLPTAGYDITVTSAAGVPLIGTSEIALEPAEADRYRERGLTNVYMGLFLGPNEGEVKATQLSTRRESYAASEKIAFAVEALSARQSSEDVVSYAYILRGEDGSIVSFEQGEAPWNDLWTGNLHVGMLHDTPQDAGRYTLSIYFDGGLVASKELRIN